MSAVGATREDVAVTQADREAAADLAAQFQRYTYVQIEAPAIRRGEHDGWELVQAFAKHRPATAESAALYNALVKAADFIQPFNRASDLLDEIDAVLALARGEAA